MKATGIVRRIDDLGRVVIPKEIRRTMHIREGEPLEIFTDRDGELILKKYSPIGELSQFSFQICESLRKSVKGTAAVCDREAFISAAGNGKKEIQDKEISPELNEIMNSRKAYCLKKGEPRLPALKNEDKLHISAACPVVSQGDVMGCVLILNTGDSFDSSETEQQLVNSMSRFLSMQMDD